MKRGIVSAYKKNAKDDLLRSAKLPNPMDGNRPFGSIERRWDDDPQYRKRMLDLGRNKEAYCNLLRGRAGMEIKNSGRTMFYQERMQRFGSIRVLTSTQSGGSGTTSLKEYPDWEEKQEKLKQTKCPKGHPLHEFAVVPKDMGSGYCSICRLAWITADISPASYCRRCNPVLWICKNCVLKDHFPAGGDLGKGKAGGDFGKGKAKDRMKDSGDWTKRQRR